MIILIKINIRARYTLIFDNSFIFNKLIKNTSFCPIQKPFNFDFMNIRVSLPA